VALLGVVVIAAALGAYFGFRAHAGGGAGIARANPSSRAQAAIAYDEATGSVLMFGGAGSTGAPEGDTWTWDGSSWSQQHPATSPSARAGGVMAYDPVNHDVLLFGGNTESRAVVGDDSAHSIPAETWSWDGHEWRRAQFGGPDFVPGSTWMATDPLSHHVVLVSGTEPLAFGCPWPLEGTEIAVRCPMVPPQSGTGAKTWTWDGGAWREAHSVAPLPAFSTDKALLTDPTTGHLALFAQTYASYQCGPQVWATPSPPPPAPTAPSSARPCIEDLAPSGVTPTVVTPCCSWSKAEWTGSAWGPWAQLGSGPGFTPGLLAADPAAHQILATGVVPQPKAHAPAFTSATWAWDGTWRRLHPATEPTFASGASAAYDAQTSQLVVFGGLPLWSGPAVASVGSAPVLDTTWTWDGTAWTLRGGNPTPPAVPPGPPTPAPPPGVSPIPGPPGSPYPLPYACPTPGAVPGAGVAPICPIPPASVPSLGR